MILALLIYLGADLGVIVAQPIVINALALGSLITSYSISCHHSDHQRLFDVVDVVD